MKNRDGNTEFCGNPDFINAQLAIREEGASTYNPDVVDERGYNKDIIKTILTP